MAKKTKKPSTRRTLTPQSLSRCCATRRTISVVSVGTHPLNYETVLNGTLSASH